ncbi:hypothetical protein [Halobacteriovorax marinus]|nr:hypothetical protein [Halobacteriovorax marinus]
MKNDVFILGAGSSASYGFPTGEQLKKIIINDGIEIHPDVYRHEDPKFYEDDDNFNSYYNSCIEYFTKKINPNFDKEKFKKDFRTAGSFTIDTYLSSPHRSDEEKEFGKYIVSSIISYYEDLDRMEMDHTDNWIDYYFNRKISFQTKDFFENLPKVISFNYDSFFENKLIHHLEKEHGIKDAKSVLNTRDFITHVYGKLNNQPYRQSNKQILTQPGAYVQQEIDFKTIYDNSKQVGFIRGNIDSNNNNPFYLAKLSRIHEIIKEADNIFILGYGFDMYNNKILFQDQRLLEDTTKRIMYTSYGLENTLIEDLNRFDAIKNTNQVKNEKCLEFLRRTMPHQLFP